MRRDPPRVEFFDAAQLIGFEPLCVAVYVTDRSIPPLKVMSQESGVNGQKADVL
jgi:hypothetical protein